MLRPTDFSQWEGIKKATGGRGEGGGLGWEFKFNFQLSARYRGAAGGACKFSITGGGSAEGGGGSAATSRELCPPAKRGLPPPVQIKIRKRGEEGRVWVVVVVGVD